ncbi:MAG: STAS domain-containing protein [Rhodothermales bacterium]
MSFETEERYHAVVIRPKGKFLGSTKGDEFRGLIDRYKETGLKNVVVDLSKTDFMDSTAIGVLIASLTTMRRAGGDVRLAEIDSRIKNLFLVTRLLGPVFTAYETVDEAEKSYVEHPAVAR